MFDYFYSDEKPFADFDHLLANERTLRQSSSQQSQAEYAIETTTYLCTMLEACGNGDLHDLIEEHVTVPEDITAS